MTDKQSQQTDELSQLSQTRFVIASQQLLANGEEKFQKSSPTSAQGPCIREALINPEDGGRFKANQSDLGNQKFKKSKTDKINVFKHNESNQTIPNSLKNQEQGVTIETTTPQYANQIENQSKPVPEQKLEDLQAVINSIDHYQINMEDLARDQPLDPSSSKSQERLQLVSTSEK